MTPLQTLLPMVEEMANNFKGKWPRSYSGYEVALIKALPELIELVKAKRLLSETLEFIDFHNPGFRTDEDWKETEVKIVKLLTPQLEVNKDDAAYRALMDGETHL